MDALPLQVTAGQLECSTTHLTTFGGVLQFPTSIEELIDELNTALTFNTFSIDEAFSLRTRAGLEPKERCTLPCAYAGIM